ncbi:AMP-binding protein [Methylocella sp.]|uniref:AMP-binding protein n=1 Tax=Methylocella sp. TaxID=1978226 RepID=UPI003783AC1D
MTERQPLFTPSAEDVAATPLSAFMRRMSERTGRDFPDYRDFEAFAIEDFRAFWGGLLDWSRLPHEGDAGRVCVGDDCETAQFFPDLRLNYAECLLRRIGPDDDSRPALRSCRPERQTVATTRGELRRRVEALAASLDASGVGPGTRVALIAHNETEAAVAMLAAAALGALVSLTATDLAAFATLSRFSQTRPEILFCNLRSPYPDVEAQLLARVGEVVAALPSVTRVIGLDPGLGDRPAAPVPLRDGVVFDTLDRLVAEAPQARKPWPRFAFNHPLFALFTSGTSGPPKCVVHGAGGVLIQNFKEMSLHLDVRAGDRVFFQTSTGWVIWLLLMSNLSVGAEVVLNSRPVVAPHAVWEIVGGEAVTIFCTSPAFLQLCEANGYRPCDETRLDALRSLMAAGSVLYAAQQDWASVNVKPLPIRSVYGSTDVAACFVLPCPNLPVHAAECQARSLGVDVRAVRQGELGLPAPIGEAACVNPFPSRPLGFLNDPDGTRFHETYFARNPGAWTQGDFIEFTPQGGARLHGRCDGVLNIRGVRIGPVEIYEAVKCAPEVAACLAVAQAWPEAPGGTRLVLLVALSDGAVLGEALTRRIKTAIRRRASAVHVPDVIAQVPELPATHNGKLSERAATDAVNGREAANRDALRNPPCLAAIAAHPALGRAPAPAAAACGALEPRSVEARVAFAFEQAFDRRPLARDENFFDLGGDSLTAMRILFTLKETLGLDVPITEIFHAPTIGALAAALAARAARAGHPSLVRLKDGADVPPLFMIPGVDGSPMKLRRLALAIDYRGPIYGLQAKGLNGEAEPLASIDAMARFHVEAIKSVAPRGPYALAGFSLGGLCAIETARALREAGDEIGALMLLDPPLEERWWPLTLWIEALARRAWLHARGMFARIGHERWRYAGRRLVGLARHVLRRYDRETRMRFAGFDPNLPPLLQAVQDHALAAALSYRPRFYDGALTLFVAARGIYQGCAAGRLWSRFAAEARVESVPGDHLSMIMPPEHRVLAAAIARSLARGDEGRAPRAEPTRPPAATGGVIEAKVGQAAPV